MKILRIGLCVLIALVTGSIGCIGYFSDFGPEESTFDRLLFIFLLYTIVCLIIGAVANKYWGAVANKYWKISILSSWGPVFMGGLIFFGCIFQGRISCAAFHFTGLVIVPLISLLFGYLGSMLSFKLVSYIKSRKLSKT
jgi:hypothetical protein